jgi:hypothetical protein
VVKRAFKRLKIPTESRFMTDFSCSKVVLGTKMTAYITANGIQQAYRKAWIKDVDEGLRK